MLSGKNARAVLAAALVAPLWLAPLATVDVAAAQDKAKPLPDKSQSPGSERKPAAGKKDGTDRKKGDDNGTGK